MRTLLILVLGILLFGCGDDAQTAQIENDLVGKWVYDQAAMLNQYEGKPVSERDLQRLEGMVRVFENGHVQFFEDGTLEMSNEGNQIVKGKWDVVKGPYLIMNVYENPDSAKISSSSPERFVLAGKEKGGIPFDRIFIPVQE